MIEIERIKPHQGELLRELRLRALQDAPDAFLENYDDARNQSLEHWEERAKRNAISSSSTYFFGFFDGNLLGMVGAYISGDEPDVTNLCAMWVAPEARQKGLGKTLVERALIWANEAHTEKVRLWFNSEDAGAEQFYRSCGFKDTGVTAVFPAKPDAVAKKMEYGFSESRAELTI